MVKIFTFLTWQGNFDNKRNSMEYKEPDIYSEKLIVNNNEGYTNCVFQKNAFSYFLAPVKQ